MQHLGGRSRVAPPGHHAQKKSLRAAERDRPDVRRSRQAWRRRATATDPNRLVFVDESGAATTLTRTYGRAARGQRVEAAVPHGFWKVVTLTAAVRLGGIPPPACLAFDGATDSACFATYVERCLAPALRPGDVVVMDNLACHKTAAVASAIAAAGAELRYLPAYSPDLNPIEKLFSKLKAHLRATATRTVQGVIAAMGTGLRAIRQRDIAGWFRSCGYRYDQS